MSRNRAILVGITGLMLAMIALEPAFASSGGGNLPWESPLQQIQQSITGPVAGFIALAWNCAMFWNKWNAKAGRSLR